MDRSRLMKKRYPRWFYTFPALCFGLGTWQVYRYQRKLTLLQDMETKLQSNPIDMNNLTDDQDIDSLLHQRVKVQGSVKRDQIMLVGPRTKHGAENTGYQIYQPLKYQRLRHYGSPQQILVNRGWVPVNDVGKFVNQSKTEQNIQIEGIVRDPRPYQSSMARLLHWCGINPNARDQTPNNDHLPRWLWLEMKDKAQYCRQIVGGDEKNSFSQNVFIEEVFAGDSVHDVIANQHLLDPNKFNGRDPIVNTASLNVRNKHLEYIVTWYSLCGLLLMILRR
ncbi:hypothetical protein MIR68_011026 [Amoeboaphelidium protococcarum]|nr:hypothetical protein MIR68_011026 [Amoeboaphelidium protococcarum]